LEILLFDRLPSTQKFLIDKIYQKIYQAPIAILTDEQTDGIGSRDNKWTAEKGNFFLSFAISLERLPSDLPLESASIYFAYLMKQTLFTMSQEVWLKWPNDLYVGQDKIGGIITKKIEDTLICGIGINLKNADNCYRAFPHKILAKELLEKYFHRVESFPSWKQVFSNFQLEFEQSRAFFVHIKDEKKSLKNAILCEDGSLIIDERKVFSLR